MSIRLSSDFWVAAYRARLDAQGIFLHVARKGDANAGAVWIKCATMNGRASVFARTYDADFNRVWSIHLDDVPESQADEALAQQAKFDRDLWIIEVEDPRGRHLLEEDGLA